MAVMRVGRGQSLGAGLGEGAGWAGGDVGWERMGVLGDVCEAVGR